MVALRMLAVWAALGLAAPAVAETPVAPGFEGAWALDLASVDIPPEARPASVIGTF